MPPKWLALACAQRRGGDPGTEGPEDEWDEAGGGQSAEAARLYYCV